MSIRLFIPDAFEPEAIAAMSEALEAACKSTGPPNEGMREAIARQILAAARFGERDPVRLMEAALSKPD